MSGKVRIFVAATWPTSPEQPPLDMQYSEYRDTRSALLRQIRAIFREKVVQIQIDSFDEAEKVEPILTPFSHVTVVTRNHLGRELLAEMAWYGCNLDDISAHYTHSTDENWVVLAFDCTEFANSRKQDYEQD